MRPPRWSAAGAAAVGLAALVLAGCEGSETRVPTPLFAQIGELRIDVRLPLDGGGGRLDGTLVWHSDGRWALSERISHRGIEGDETTTFSRLNPGELAPEYAALIGLLNQEPGIRLRGAVDESLEPVCDPPRSLIIFTMLDTHRGEFSRWTRCVDGTLFSITPGSAGPDADAARVVTAAQLVRSFTVGDARGSVFQGSVPFGSLARSEDSPARPGGPRVFVSQSGTPPPEWEAFWAAHADATAPPPVVDWENEMVLLAATGMRTEAGHRIRVRRVLPVGASTRVESVEEVPGDFCSPAARDRWPVHAVVAPRTQQPVLFSEPVRVRVPCGT